jgi:hypothetical protein
VHPLTKATYRTRTAASVAMTLLGTLGIAGTAQAFSVTPTSDSDRLLSALLGNTAGLSNFEVSLTGNPLAIGTFEDSPFGLNSGVVLSTGQVADLPGLNTLDGSTSENGFPQKDLSTNFGGILQSDSTMLNISFDVDDTVDRLFFNYVFGSEEFLEYGGRAFNDSFSLLLNGQNLAFLSDGQAVTINNLIPDANNPASFHPDYINNPVGTSVPTKLDGFTKVLGFEGLLNQNSRNTLSIRIRDVGDNQFDSSVFLHSIGTAEPPDTSVPEPGTILGCLALAGVALRRKSKSKFG